MLTGKCEGDLTTVKARIVYGRPRYASRVSRMDETDGADVRSKIASSKVEAKRGTTVSHAAWTRTSHEFLVWPRNTVQTRHFTVVVPS